LDLLRDHWVNANEIWDGLTSELEARGIAACCPYRFAAGSAGRNESDLACPVLFNARKSGTTEDCHERGSNLDSSDQTEYVSLLRHWRKDLLAA
jgi:hypothetical protein